MQGLVWSEVLVGVLSPEMSDSRFNVGDIVKLKSGGPEMTVEDVGGDAISCVWFTDAEIGRSKFLEETLQKAVTFTGQVDHLTGDPAAGNGFVTGG
jgi:uncharacterized protein YodC (DUF2158 family)